MVKDEYCEVVCGEHNEHRADILTDKYAIELQYSSISLDAVKERSYFYSKLKGQRVVWVVNAYKPWRDKRISTAFSKVEKGNLDVSWKRPKKWVTDISGLKITNVFLDISPSADNLLRIWLHEGALFGRWMKKNDFYNVYLKNYSETTDNFKEIFSELNRYDYQ